MVFKAKQKQKKNHMRPSANIHAHANLFHTKEKKRNIQMATTAI